MIKGHFIPSQDQNLFVCQYGNWQKTAILCMPSSFEELNLARAIVAKQAQYFAAHGLPCIVMDYAGTGDSEGEFEQFSVSNWLENVIDVGQWMMSQGVERIIIWGIRFGGLITLAHQQILHEKLPIVHQLLWKPVPKGKPFMSQFIRLKQASDMMQSGQNKINWRDKILAGEPVEIAGYWLNAEHIKQIEALQLTGLPGSRVSWLEYAAKSVTPAITKAVAEWPEEQVTIETIDCSAFWQIPEIFDMQSTHELNWNMVKEAF